MSDIPDAPNPLAMASINELVQELERRSESIVLALTAPGDAPNTSGCCVCVTYSKMPFELYGLCDMLDTMARDEIEKYLKRLRGEPVEEEDEEEEDGDGWKKKGRE